MTTRFLLELESDFLKLMRTASSPRAFLKFSRDRTALQVRMIRIPLKRSNFC